MDKFRKQLIRWIEEQAEKNWSALIDADGDAIPDEDAFVWKGIEDLMEWIHDEVSRHPDILAAIKEARITISETAAEQAEYSRAMNGGVDSQLRYYGMKRSDFV